MKALNPTRDQDALNDVLSHIYVKGAIYCRSDLRPPWAFSVDRRPAAGFHAITRGKGWLKVEGESSKIAVCRGDLIVLPHGHAHVLSDAFETAPTPLEEMVAKHPLEDGIRLRMGESGPATILLCGEFQFDGRSAHPLVANLPKLIHIPGRNGEARLGIHSTLQQIEV